VGVVVAGVSGMQLMLCGWYIYMAVLAGLAALSAGPRTGLGLLALAGAGAAAVLVLLLFWSPPIPGLSTYRTAVTFGLTLVPVAAGLAQIVAAPRQDTKLIGVLLAGASALPLLLYFWHPGQ
jgi:hypothetical protein